MKDINWENTYGSVVCQHEFGLGGMEGSAVFDVYDGFACCKDFNGHYWTISFPKLKYVNNSERISEELRKRRGLGEDDDFDECDCLLAFGEISMDGVRVRFDSEKGEYVDAEIWKRDY